MAVVIQDFQAVQETPAAENGGTSAPKPGPVADAALDRLLNASRARRLRLWAN